MRSNFLSTPRQFTSVWDIMNEFDKTFNRSINGDFDSTTQALSQFTPQVDIEETNDFYMFSFDLPGIKKDQINIEVVEGVLRVRGERSQEKRVNEKQYSRVERQFGSFERSFRLPTNIEESKVQANFEDGVLEVLVPKAELSKPRSVKIESGKGGLFSRLLGSKDESKTVDVKDSH